MNRTRIIIYAVITVGSIVSLYALGKTGILTYNYVRAKQELKIAERNMSGSTSNLDTVFMGSRVSHKQLIGALSNACNHERAKVIEIQPARIHQGQAVQYVDQQVTMQGYFVDMVRCVANAEPSLYPARIISLQFRKTKVANRESILSMQVYYQYITLNE